MVMEFLVPGMPAIIAATGADFALFDMEHTGASLETMKAMVAGCRGIGLAPLVRVPRGEYHFIARALDIGAHGVMVPMVAPAEAAHIAACAHYPPAGRRGAAFGVAHDDYRATDPATAMARAAERHGDRADRDGGGPATTSRRSPPRRASTWCGSAIST